MGQLPFAAIHWAAPIPSARPMKPPTLASTTASVRNWKRMSRLRPPTAMRMPISRVRSVTDTSMTLAIPMPPTISEMAATASSNVVIVSAFCLAASSISTWFRMWKSGSAWSERRWRWRSNAVTSRTASATWCEDRAEIISFPTALDCEPMSLRTTVDQGMRIVSSSSVPPKVCPLLVRIPITLQGTCLTRICSPTTGAPGMNSFFTTVSPRMQTFAAEASSSRPKAWPSASGRSRTWR